MNDTQVAGRRPRRGGQGRSRRQGGGGFSAERRAPEKKTFWQKVAAFFKGEKKSTPTVSTGTRKSETPQRPSSRKPEVVEVSSPKLYVGNLSFDATESDLNELFNGVGQVNNAEIVSHKYTQKSKGFAFVTMNTIDEAKRAVTELHDKEFMGRKLVVSGAKTSDLRS
ncbi:MAG: RNA-binding protein [Verrucomicrobiota bacterium]